MKSEMPKQQPELPRDREGTSSPDAPVATDNQDAVVSKELELQVFERELKKAERRLRRAQEFQHIQHKQLLLLAEIIVESRIQGAPTLRADSLKGELFPHPAQNSFFQRLLVCIDESPRLFRKYLWASLRTVGVVLVIFIFFKISLSNAKSFNWLLGNHRAARVSTFPPGTDFPELHFERDDGLRRIKPPDTNDTLRVQGNSFQFRR